MISRGGNILHTWQSGAKNGISFAELVERPPEMGGGRLAIIGFNSRAKTQYAGALCAFDVGGDLDRPAWSGHIETQEILPELLARDFTGEQFSASRAIVADVFPDRPGEEVVVAHMHGPYSACVIRIYDLNGETLFQAWQDGGVNSSYWMSDAELLVFSGLDARAYWDERGHPEVLEAHPVVVFAVRPELGYTGTQWLNEGNDKTVRWYKCILPPESSDDFREGKLFPPAASEEPGRNVRLTLMFAEAENAIMSWLIDENGVEQRDMRVINDPYKRAGDTLPPPDRFYLGELPPIVSPPE